MNFEFICFPSIPWNHSWERQQELMYRFAIHYSNATIKIVHPMGLVNHNISGIIAKTRLRFTSCQGNSYYQNKKTENMEFIKSAYIPYHFNKPIDFINQKILLKSLRIDGSKKQIMWATYVNGFIFNIFMKAHYKILDFATRRQVSQELPDAVKLLEIEAVKIADIVFVDNYNTYLDYYPYNKNIFYVPQGVNIEDFSSDDIALEYKYLKDENRKIIGYCGNLHQYVDYSLLAEIIPYFSEHIFVFVGNIMDGRAKDLMKYDNVIFAGFKPHNELNKYYRLFDVGLIPYTIEPFTTGVYPTKFLEYAANRVPILSSKLPDLEQYKISFLKIYSDKSSFINYLSDLLNSNLSDEMDSFVLQHTWKHRFTEIIDKLEALIK